MAFQRKSVPGPSTRLPQPRRRPDASAPTNSAQVGKRSSGFLLRARAIGPRSHSGNGRQVRRCRQVLHQQLAGVAAVERPLPGEQFLVDDGQAVLIAEAADHAVERFRGRVDRRDAAGDWAPSPFQVLDQAEVGDLDVVVDQEQVLRLDVEVLQLVLDVHQVERLGRLLHVAEQLVARDARQSLAAALLEAVPEVAVGQLHDDDQLAVDDVEAFQRQDEGMADRLDAVEGLELLLGPGRLRRRLPCRSP